MAGNDCPSQAVVTSKTYDPMLWTLFVILLILWLLGFTVFHIGSLIHIILVVALIVLVFQLITGRRV